MSIHLTLKSIILSSLLSQVSITPLSTKAQSANPSTDTGMVNASVNEKDELRIIPSKNSSEKDFDFFDGSWNVTGKRLKTRLHNSNEWVDFTAKLKCSKIIQGFGNEEPYYQKVNGQDFEAFTLRLFDTKTRLWSIYYANPNYVSMESPQVGSFENNIGLFYSKDTWEGKKIIIVYKWDRTNPDKPTMSQAFSTDNGKTWEWNLRQHFEKTGD
jgi:hypothetical protein